MNKKYSESLEEIDSLAELLGLLIVALIIIGIIFGILGLVCWGVVNGMFFICGINATFTYTQGLVMALVASFGGPTGPALNPARDLGPRILHAILPIKNKGTSQWDYAWVPVLAPICASICACLLYSCPILHSPSSLLKLSHTSTSDLSDFNSSSINCSVLV